MPLVEIKCMMQIYFQALVMTVPWGPGFACFPVSAWQMQLRVKWTGISTLSLGVNASVWLFVFVFWPCGELASCPGCSPSLAQRQLGEAPAPREKGWKSSYNMMDMLDLFWWWASGSSGSMWCHFRESCTLCASVTWVKSEQLYLLWRLFKWRDKWSSTSRKKCLRIALRGY